jgi:hypothetical protein
MFPAFEGKHLPHLEELVINQLTARDLICLKLVNKECAAKISRWLRREMANDRVPKQLEDAWSTHIKKPILFRMSHYNDAQKCPKTGNILILFDKDLVECRLIDLFVVSTNRLHSPHDDMGHATTSGFRIVGNLLLVQTFTGLELFEWKDGQFTLSHNNIWSYNRSKRSVFFNGKFAIVMREGSIPMITEVCLDQINNKGHPYLHYWCSMMWNENPECLRHVQDHLITVDETSGNFAIIFRTGVEKIHILSGKDLSLLKSIVIPDYSNCPFHFRKTRISYRHPYFAVACDCSMYVWNMDTEQMTGNYAISLNKPMHTGDVVVTDVLITELNVLLYTVTDSSSDFADKEGTSVFSILLSTAERSTAPLPTKILYQPGILYSRLLVFGTRIILHSGYTCTEYGGGRYTEDKNTIVIGDVWNEDSVSMIKYQV